jgi:hypothetical protein
MNLEEHCFFSKRAKNRALPGILTTVMAVTIVPAFGQGSPVPGSGGAAGSNGTSNSYGNAFSRGNSTNAYGGQGGQPGSGANVGLGGSASSASAPVPGYGRMAGATNMHPSKTSASKYHDLPITVDSAKYRLEELRAMLAVTKPQDMQDSVQELCEWLNDASDAHYRMYLAFAKSDLTRVQANSEKQLNQHFGQLKREAQLLRADLLIKQLRAPEALSPLVDIVVADPRSATGKEAYKRLVDLGFSQAVTQPAAQSAAQTAKPEAAYSGSATVPVTAPVVAPHDMKTQANSKALRPLH